MGPFTDVVVRGGTRLRAVLEVMTRSGIQIVLVVDGDRRLLGVATDGDLRKALLRGATLETRIDEAMNGTPVVARPDLSPADAIELMRSRSIRHLPLVDAHRVPVDLLVLDHLLAPPPPLSNPAVIMAGGEGRRLWPLTESTPKPLLEIGGKPILEILIERLRRSGITDVVITLHHRSDMIRESLGDGGHLGVRIAYVEEPRPLGTMGSLTLARERLTRPFFVVNGDILTKCSFRSMWDFHRGRPGVAMTVGVSLHQVEIPYGEFALKGERVTRVDEKPMKEFPVNAGIYLLEPSVVDMIPPNEYFDATDLIRLLLSKGREVAAYMIREYWLDVGRHSDLERARRDAAEGLLE